MLQLRQEDPYQGLQEILPLSWRVIHQLQDSKRSVSAGMGPRPRKSTQRGFMQRRSSPHGCFLLVSFLKSHPKKPFLQKSPLSPPFPTHHLTSAKKASAVTCRFCEGEYSHGRKACISARETSWARSSTLHREHKQVTWSGGKDIGRGPNHPPL